MSSELKIKDLDAFRAEVMQAAEREQVENLIKTGDILVPLSFSDLNDLLLGFTEVLTSYEGDEIEIYREHVALQMMKNKLHKIQG